MADQQIGERLDAMGVTAELDEADLVSDAVVVLVIHEPGDREPRIEVVQSAGTSNLTASGIIHAASVLTDAGWRNERDA